MIAGPILSLSFIIINMRTLLFCTAYFNNNLDRYIEWINYYKNIFPKYDLLLVHDGPISKEDIKEIINGSQNAVTEDDFIYFEEKLPRNDHIFPGWWRSFITATKYFGIVNYDKIVHIESDAYILSKRMIDFIKNQNESWTVPISRKYGFPESAIQIICKDCFHLIENLPDEFDFHCIVEMYLPFKFHAVNFVGDRYGETGQLPPYKIDYVCQWDPNWGIPSDWIIE